MNRQELIAELAERLKTNCAESMQRCDRVSERLERKPLSLESELAMVDAAFAEDSTCVL